MVKPFIKSGRINKNKSSWSCDLADDALFICTSLIKFHYLLRTFPISYPKKTTPSIPRNLAVNTRSRAKLLRKIDNLRKSKVVKYVPAVWLTSEIGLRKTRKKKSPRRARKRPKNLAYTAATVRGSNLLKCMCDRNSFRFATRRSAACTMLAGPGRCSGCSFGRPSTYQKVGQTIL